MNNQPQQKKNQFENFSILIGNYPLFVDPDAIIEQIKNIISKTSGFNLTIKKGILSTTFLSQQFSILVPNQAQFDSILALNGYFVFNSKIWIIRFPFEFLQLGQILPVIINRSISDGIYDLGNLRDQFSSNGIDPNIVNFDNYYFVEYLFYCIGSEARDQRFLIVQMIATNNNIHDINSWPRFLHFIPSLRILDVRNNPLVNEPKIPESYGVQVMTDIQFLQQKRDDKNQQMTMQQQWEQNSNMLKDDGNWEIEINLPGISQNQMKGEKKNNKQNKNQFNKV